MKMMAGHYLLRNCRGIGDDTSIIETVINDWGDIIHLGISYSYPGAFQYRFKNLSAVGNLMVPVVIIWPANLDSIIGSVWLADSPLSYRVRSAMGGTSTVSTLSRRVADTDDEWVPMASGLFVCATRSAKASVVFLCQQGDFNALANYGGEVWIFGF